LSKKFIRQRLIQIVFALLICFLVWTYIKVKTEDAAELSDSISIEAIPEYRIVTGADMKLWPKNTVLNQGMAAYFYITEPIVNVTPVIQLKGAQISNLEGNIKSSIMLKAVNDRAEVYWSYQLEEKEDEKFLLNGELDHDAKGNNVISYKAQEIILNPAAAAEMAAQFNDELLLRGGLNQLVLTSDIELVGTINGEEANYSISFELPLTLHQDNFTIPRTTEITSQLQLGIGKLQAQDGIILDTIRKHTILFVIDASLAILLLALLIGTGISKNRMDIERNRYKEWITEGSVELQDMLPIKIFSLQGLVDLAIDLDKRVIYDPGINKYFILDEDIAYIYDPEYTSTVIGNKTRLGKLLLEKRLLQPQELELGLHYQKLTGMRLGESLIALGLIDETSLYSTLAAQQKVNYYELDQEYAYYDFDWLNKMSLAKARALMSLPLGANNNGKLVIACAEPASEGIKKALYELFGEDIVLVATRPTSVFKALDKIERQQKRAMSINQDEAFAQLSAEEKGQFALFYADGKLMQGLLLKAADLSDTDSKELSSLLKGLDKAVEEMKDTDRQNGKLPDLLDVLKYANYLNSDTVDCLIQESKATGKSVRRLLIDNYLASESTIKKIEELTGVIEKLIKH